MTEWGSKIFDELIGIWVEDKGFIADHYVEIIKRENKYILDECMKASIKGYTETKKVIKQLRKERG